ncbi:hypothetical protein TanjilG_01506, partial [Lupinus angustifolius]
RAHAFKYEVNRLVTELKSSSQYVEDKLDSIDEKAEEILQGSKQIHDSVVSIDVHSQKVAQTIENVEDHIGLVLRHSESVYEKTTKIAVSQSELQEGQEDMSRNLTIIWA